MNRPAFRCTSRYHQRMGTAGRMGTKMERTSERSKRGHVVLGFVGLMFTAAVLLHGPAPAHAQPSDKSDKKPGPAKSGATAPAVGNVGNVPKAGSGNTGKPKVFDFTGLDIAGRLRTPQLMYFLERANEELERASLEKRSFVPSMVRSIDDEAL